MISTVLRTFRVLLCFIFSPCGKYCWYARFIEEETEVRAFAKVVSVLQEELGFISRSVLFRSPDLWPYRKICILWRKTLFLCYEERARSESFKSEQNWPQGSFLNSMSVLGACTPPLTSFSFASGGKPVALMPSQLFISLKALKVHCHCLALFWFFCVLKYVFNNAIDLITKFLFAKWNLIIAIAVPGPDRYHTSSAFFPVLCSCSYSSVLSADCGSHSAAPNGPRHLFLPGPSLLSHDSSVV